jgi:hypothetical protein
MPTRDRDALYYPYIRIHSQNWLKATLLCFPRVRRILPENFTPFDVPEVKAFTDLRLGPADPLPLLCGEIPSYDPAVDQAYGQLFGKIRADESLIREKYSKDATVREFGKAGAEAFRIHSGKMNDEIINYLGENNLAWDGTGRFARYAGWYFVHPKLGEAIMSTAAIAIAKRWDLDIVTDEPRVHIALATLDDEAVYQELASIPKQGVVPDSQEVADELSMLVMTTAFDFSRLTPDQILELKKEGKDLRKFRDKTMELAGRVPRIPDLEDRKKALQPYVEELIQDWQKYKDSLPRFALDAIFEALKLDGKDLMAAAATAGGSYLAFGGKFGLAIGAVVYGGYKAWRGFHEKLDNPLQFLSRVESAGASLVFPPSAAGS